MIRIKILTLICSYGPLWSFDPTLPGKESYRGKRRDGKREREKCKVLFLFLFSTPFSKPSFLSSFITEK